MRTRLMAALALAALLGACGDDNTTTPRAGDTPGATASVSPTPTPPPTAAVPTVNGTDSGAADLLVGMSTAHFEPRMVTAKAGTVYDLKADNPSAMPHSFTITSLKIDVELPRRSVTFAALPKFAPGTLDFFCKYHIDMKGTLTVT